MDMFFIFMISFPGLIPKKGEIIVLGFSDFAGQRFMDYMDVWGQWRGAVVMGDFALPVVFLKYG